MNKVSDRQSRATSYVTGVVKRSMHYRSWIAAVPCAALAVTFLLSCNSSKARPSEAEIAVAENEVYEAVVRDMVPQTSDGQAHVIQLVFNDALLTSLTTGPDLKSCEERTSMDLRLESGKLPYNSLGDKIYRVFTRSGHDDSLRADTIQDFVEKSCTAGHLSHTFHTDLPRTFVAAKSVRFRDWPIEKNGPLPFEQQFPGTNGMISFSHVGFDSSLQEAMVTVSFICGGLCDSGDRYVLRKESGRWEVVNKWMLWIS
jgi:hypothetical protein